MNCENKKVLICDLDGCLFDHSNRKWLYPRPEIKGEDRIEKRNEYHRNCIFDPMDENIRDIIMSYSRRGIYPIYLTARPAAYWPETSDWLLKNNFYLTTIIMRPEGNIKPQAEFKKDMFFQQIAKHNVKVELCIDDDKSVIDMWRDMGFYSLHYSKPGN